MDYGRKSNRGRIRGASWHRGSVPGAWPALEPEGEGTVAGCGWGGNEIGARQRGSMWTDEGDRSRGLWDLSWRPWVKGGGVRMDE